MYNIFRILQTVFHFWRQYCPYIFDLVKIKAAVKPFYNWYFLRCQKLFCWFRIMNGYVVKLENLLLIEIITKKVITSLEVLYTWHYQFLWDETFVCYETDRRFAFWLPKSLHNQLRNYDPFSNSFSVYCANTFGNDLVRSVWTFFHPINLPKIGTFLQMSMCCMVNLGKGTRFIYSWIESDCKICCIRDSNFLIKGVFNFRRAIWLIYSKTFDFPNTSSVNFWFSITSLDTSIFIFSNGINLKPQFYFFLVLKPSLAL